MAAYSLSVGSCKQTWHFQVPMTPKSTMQHKRTWSLGCAPLHNRKTDINTPTQSGVLVSLQQDLWRSIDPDFIRRYQIWNHDLKITKRLDQPTDHRMVWIPHSRQMLKRTQIRSQVADLIWMVTIASATLARFWKPLNLHGFMSKCCTRVEVRVEPRPLHLTHSIRLMAQARRDVR